VKLKEFRGLSLSNAKILSRSSDSVVRSRKRQKKTEYLEKQTLVLKRIETLKTHYNYKLTTQLIN